MAWYEFLQFSHISTAVICVGGVAIVQVLGVAREDRLRYYTVTAVAAS
jgi:hypothetical protein